MEQMDLSTLRAVGNRLLLHLPKRVEDTIRVGGRELYFDGTFAEQANKRLAAVVVGRPGRAVGRHAENHLFYRRGQPDVRVYVEDIADELCAGDVVLVDWTVSEPHFEVEGLGGVYWANYSQVVARVREGEVVPFGSYCFCREVYPADVQAVELPGVPGKLHLRVSASGLAMGSESVPPLPFRGEVVKVGKPLRGQPRRFGAGDVVLFDKRYCSPDTTLPVKLKLEGTEYLCIRQDYVEAVLSHQGHAYDWEAINNLLVDHGRPYRLADFMERYQMGREDEVLRQAVALGYVTPIPGPVVLAN